jgi:hypothetical protein
MNGYMSKRKDEYDPRYALEFQTENITVNILYPYHGRRGFLPITGNNISEYTLSTPRNRPLKVAVQRPDFMAHPHTYIHTHPEDHKINDDKRQYAVEVVYSLSF